MDSMATLPCFVCAWPRVQCPCAPVEVLLGDTVYMSLLLLLLTCCFTTSICYIWICFCCCCDILLYCIVLYHFLILFSEYHSHA